MVLFKDFEVRVALKSADGRSAGEALSEYPNPKSDTTSDDLSVERYIEAKPGQEFQIEVHLKPAFNLFAADFLQVSLNIDGDTVMFKKPFSKDKVARHQEQKEPLVIYDVLSSEGGNYSRVSFCFGSLSAGESSQ